MCVLWSILKSDRPEWRVLLYLGLVSAIDYDTEPYLSCHQFVAHLCCMDHHAISDFEIVDGGGCNALLVFCVGHGVNGDGVLGGGFDGNGIVGHGCHYPHDMLPFAVSKQTSRCEHNN